MRCPSAAGVSPTARDAARKLKSSAAATKQRRLSIEGSDMPALLEDAGAPSQERPSRACATRCSITLRPVPPKKKPERARTARRAADRELDRVREAATKLYSLEPGGSPERPIELASPSQVEIEAESRRCPRCDGALRCETHEVALHEGLRLRVARLACRSCAARWDRYFRIGPLLS